MEARHLQLHLLSSCAGVRVACIGASCRKPRLAFCAGVRGGAQENQLPRAEAAQSVVVAEPVHAGADQRSAWHGIFSMVFRVTEPRAPPSAPAVLNWGLLFSAPRPGSCSRRGAPRRERHEARGAVATARAEIGLVPVLGGENPAASAVEAGPRRRDRARLVLDGEHPAASVIPLQEGVWPSGAAIGPGLASATTVTRRGTGTRPARPAIGIASFSLCAYSGGEHSAASVTPRHTIWRVALRRYDRPSLPPSDSAIARVRGAQGHQLPQAKAVRSLVATEPPAPPPVPAMLEWKKREVLLTPFAASQGWAERGGDKLSWAKRRARIATCLLPRAEAARSVVLTNYNLLRMPTLGRIATKPPAPPPGQLCWSEMGVHPTPAAASRGLCKACWGLLFSAPRPGSCSRREHPAASATGRWVLLQTARAEVGFVPVLGGEHPTASAVEAGPRHRDRARLVLGGEHPAASVIPR
ncbi:hypothetical protein T492DRAFT_840988 [Pavlovales sp. CCMP2436]|nr:hypothetical protein T492DRAFT_840988 [Pavlovales sp. CCMP2436]